MRSTRLVFAGLLAVVVLILVMGERIAAPALAVPANDNFANAITVNTPAVSGLVAAADVSGGTTEGSEKTVFASGECGVAQSATITNTVWYTWTSPASPTNVIFETQGSDFDSHLALYTGSGFPLTQVACSDTFISDDAALSFTPAATTTYRIQVGKEGGAGGTQVFLSMTTGALIMVTTTSDENDSTINGFNVSLREAILFATDLRDPGGLESVRVLGSPGASSSDLIRFETSSVFPPGAPATIVPGSALPALNTGGDNISGVGAGVILDGDPQAVICLTISGSQNHVEGLRLQGCAPTAIQVTGANNVIGGATVAGQRNMIVSDPPGTLGVYISGVGATGNVVSGNLIGTDGVLDLGQLQSGVRVSEGAQTNTIGGATVLGGNVISGSNTGVDIRGNGTNYNQVIGNQIGTNSAGSGPIGNATGVDIRSFAQYNSIGGTDPGEANVIAFNSADGVVVDSASSNTIRVNIIHSNAALGINLSTNGNANIIAPSIGSVTGGAVSGATCGLCTVDIYNDASDEGRFYRGSATADAAGNFSVSGIVSTLANITATITDASGNTSEFSASFATPPNSDGDGAADSADGCPLVPEDVDGFEDGDSCPDSDNDLDGICDSGQSSVSCTGSDTGKTAFFAAGHNHTAPITDCRNMAEDYDAFKDTDGCPEPDNDNDGKSDFDDQCDGSDVQTGPDTVLGSGEDQNHNGKLDGGEDTVVVDGVLTTDDTQLTFEDYDTILDNDGCHDSPGDDRDGDGFTDEAEVLFIGTDAAKNCGSTGWPADVAGNDNILNIGDFNSFLFPLRAVNDGHGLFNKFGHPVPDSDSNIARWNLAGGNDINIGDLNALNPGVNAPTSRPPMFGGQPAFFTNGGQCPYPP